MIDKSLMIISIVCVLAIGVIFIKGMPEAEKEQCTGKTQFYAFGGKFTHVKTTKGNKHGKQTHLQL